MDADTPPVTFEEGIDEVMVEVKKRLLEEKLIDEALLELKHIIISKQLDYGKENILKFGEYGVLVRTSDKFERLTNLLQKSQIPKNESIDDTWIDLAGYSVLAKMLRNQTFRLPLETKKEPK